MKKILVATQKPFAAEAKEKITSAVAGRDFTVEFLEKYTEAGQLKSAIADADALIVRSDIVDADVLDAAPQLKVVVRAGAGYDNLDLDALHQRGIFAMNTPGQNANGVAEMAVAMLIFMSRNCFTPGVGNEIEGKTLGLHGFGAVARLVAGKAALMGMKVIAYDPFVPAELYAEAGVEQVSTLEELYGGSYAVSIHVPALPQTIGCVNSSVIGAMTSAAKGQRRIIVNTARAEVVDDDAMFEAMQNNAKLCYISDVAHAEECQRFVEAFGPRAWFNAQKSGGQTSESNTRCAQAAATRIIDFFAGVPQKGL